MWQYPADVCYNAQREGRSMKIVTLIENTACREGLAAEHGLSLYIETGDKRILFDAGQTDAFAENAKKLGVDLSRVDFAVLSHGHYDHGGGLLRFLDRNTAAKVYVSPFAFEPHHNASGKYIGLAQGLQNCDRLTVVSGELSLCPGITLVSGNGLPQHVPVDDCGLTVMKNGQLLPEDFRHEQYLLIEEKGKRFLFSGCSHRGILNITKWFPSDVLIGGFHFVKLPPEGKEVRDAAKALLEQPTVYYTGHCTGLAQYQTMKEIMGRRLHAICAGSVLEL